MTDLFVPRRGGLRFALTLGAFAAVVALLFRDSIVGPLVSPLRVLTARAVLLLIQQIGMDAVREGSAIYHAGGFAYEISRGCLALVPAGFLVVSVLAYPGKTGRKLAAITLGVPLLLGLNLVRLVNLFYLGVHRADLFGLAHQVVWQGVMILAVLALWLASTRHLAGTRHLAISGRPSRSLG